MSMENQLNTMLIKIISESLSPNTNLANFLIKVLQISREAVYRRLRGDVPFTLQEVTKIAYRLNLSLDRLVGNNEAIGASINMNLIKSPHSLYSYNDALKFYRSELEKMKNNPTATVYSATNMLPFSMYSQYKHLTKFRVSRWWHQTNQYKRIRSLKDVNFPMELYESHIKVSDLLRSMANSIYIFDSNIYLSIVEELHYFHNLKFISDEDVRKIKKELLDSLHVLEAALTESRLKNGGNIEIYLSNLAMEATYLYIETDNSQVSSIRVFAINLIDTQNVNLCRIHKEWILSLKRYSTLITQSNEMDRLAFLNKQLEYINTL